MTNESRFFAKVDMRDEGECWTWTGAKKLSGYGNFYMDGRYVGAHVASWVLHNGPLPPGAIVCHKCDEPSCVNQKHLFLGTPKSNMQDMRNKGRAKGVHEGREKHPVAKLTEAAVVEIREMRKSGAHLKAIGKLYGVSESNVHHVCSNKTWKVGASLGVQFSECER